MKYRIVKIWVKIKSLLFGKKSHDFFVFLFFFVVSSGFWLLQTLNETFESEISIPLELKNVPENVHITTGLPPQLNITIKERGTTLLRFFRYSVHNAIEVDFDKYDAGLTNARVQVPTVDVQRLIQKQLGVTSHITSMRPDTLEYYYNRGVARRLPVKICGSISASPQNYIQSITLSEDSVMVYAPNAVLDTMQYAYSQAVNLSGMKENSVHNVSFRRMKGVEYEPNTVQMTAHVGYYAEKTVEVPIIGLNFPGDKELRTFPSKAKVTFRVESGRYQRITAENFVLAITYEELLQNPTDKYRLHLKSLPEGVTNARISPREVDYLIELSEMEGEGQ
ncbi:MAG: YbbR-like domain-containing protein [Bacteroidaceae bacterium]|nr:YbbR-like domain-containing protein [Bacteroidaceae bacterium]